MPKNVLTKGTICTHKEIIENLKALKNKLFSGMFREKALQT